MLIIVEFVKFISLLEIKNVSYFVKIVYVLLSCDPLLKRPEISTPPAEVIFSGASRSEDVYLLLIGDWPRQTTTGIDTLQSQQYRYK